MSAILYYISGHGYGHAVRSSQVVRSLRNVRPDLKIHIRTGAPQWLFPQSVSLSQRSIDIGIVQRDGLTMELGATLAACRALHEKLPEMIGQEIAFLTTHDIGLIVGDIPPLCFEIAARAAIPSVAITNFTWDWIYRAYLGDYPDFLPLIEEMEGFYKKATLALTLPYPGNMSLFAQQQPIPWIARASTLTKEEARKTFALPGSTPLVLLSFGGLGLSRLPWDKLQQLSEFCFIATGETKKQEGNLIILPNAQRQYEDLVRAADVIITKPGYGIVADVIAHRVPLLYTHRGEFPEYPRLVAALNDYAIAEFIPQDELLAGNIKPYLTRLSHKEAIWPVVSMDGAQAAAARIVAMIDDQS